jgi:hypothetical protein
MMPKMYAPKFRVLLFLLGLSCFTFGQNPSKPAAKYKPPVVKTYIGTYTGNGTKISTAEGKQVIALPLKIVDAKNNVYPVTSYQFSYNRIGIKEDETTGTTSPEKDMVADRFRDTPLSTVWINTIQEGLHSGEELYFFDIVAKDKQGKMFFAPELKLVVE